MGLTWGAGATAGTSVGDFDSLGVGWGWQSRDPRSSYSWMFRKHQTNLILLKLYLVVRRWGWRWERERRP